jgi:hypothetical protein
MFDIYKNLTKDLYTDIDKAVQYCKSVSNCKYQDRTIFHCYWRVPKAFTVKHLLPIKSYFVTQDLDNTELWLWSNVDLTKNELLKPFLNRINFKIYDPINESKNTILEGKNNILHSSDELCYLDGDLFRLLALNNYGGVYFDLDVVLLRDFSPLLHKEFAYQWGTTQDVNGAVMRLFKDSDLSKFLLKELSIKNPSKRSTCWGSFLLTKAYYSSMIKVLPAAFFNTEWQYTDEQLNKDEELKNFVFYPFKKTKYSSEFYEGVFSWHWHNQWDAVIEDGSKFNLLNKAISKKFEEMFE